jgi:hypothetical protein
MGPQLPLLSASPAERMGEIKALASELLAFEMQHRGQPAQAARRPQQQQQQQ